MRYATEFERDYLLVCIVRKFLELKRLGHIGRRAKVYIDGRLQREYIPRVDQCASILVGNMLLVL